MSGHFVLLHSALSKAPAVWDTELADSLNNCMISEQVQEAYTFLSLFQATYKCPYPNMIERFFATMSKMAYELPAHFQKANWHTWQYGPTLLAEQYQKGVFTLDDTKFLKEKTSPLVLSSSTQQNPKKWKTKCSPSAQPDLTLKVGPPLKTEKPQRKCMKHEPNWKGWSNKAG
ncbi:hypothetical protein EV421DRAFT_1912606 [Armillaria borealis]|uniref:Uncharacterized protein n=1 Tax=Armillaria borealis TaxID=47425 RepID=A0AA39MDB8_9AGAR|nr:hypothetical protein EV421DRAFT_1912606 [Armillaria borealis]